MAVDVAVALLVGAVATAVRAGLVFAGLRQISGPSRLDMMEGSGNEMCCLLGAQRRRIILEVA